MGVEERINVVEVLALGIDPPVIADTGTSLREIVREMRDRRTSCALLTREDRLAGVFTERDVVTRVAGVRGVLDGAVDGLCPVHLLGGSAGGPELFPRDPAR